MENKIIEFSMVTVWDWAIQLLALFIIMCVLIRVGAFLYYGTKQLKTKHKKKID